MAGLLENQVRLCLVMPKQVSGPECIVVLCHGQWWRMLHWDIYSPRKLIANHWWLKKKAYMMYYFSHSLRVDLFENILLMCFVMSKTEVSSSYNNKTTTTTTTCKCEQRETTFNIYKYDSISIFYCLFEVTSQRIATSVHLWYKFENTTFLN